MHQTIVCDYVGQDDIVVVKSKLDDQGWWEGTSESSGRRGMFPNNFVEAIPDGRGLFYPAEG